MGYNSLHEAGALYRTVYLSNFRFDWRKIFRIRIRIFLALAVHSFNVSATTFIVCIQPSAMYLAVCLICGRFVPKTSNEQCNRLLCNHRKTNSTVTYPWFPFPYSQALKLYLNSHFSWNFSLTLASSSANSSNFHFDMIKVIDNRNASTTDNASSCGYDVIDQKWKPWQPSLSHRAPWLELLAMLGALIGMLAAIIVL